MRIGNREIEDLKFGSLQCEKVYVGSSVVWEKGGLPSGYRRVEYLESTYGGGQYINTGWTDNSPTTGVYIKAQITANIGADFCVAGVLIPNRSLLFNMLKFGSSYKNSGVGLDGSTLVPVTASDICEHWVNFLNDNKKRIVINSVEQVYENMPENISTTNNFSYILFGAHYTTPQPYGLGPYRIYEFKMSKGTDIVIDLIPCLDNDDRPCMYDTVSKQTFYNAGTGEFLYGNIIN